MFNALKKPIKKDETDPDYPKIEFGYYKRESVEYDGINLFEH
jgi:hypothetical protein